MVVLEPSNVLLDKGQCGEVLFINNHTAGRKGTFRRPPFVPHNFYLETMALLAESHDSSYLSGANDTTATSASQGNNDIAVGGMTSAWTSPAIRPQATAGTSTSLSSSGGPLTSPLSPSSPVQLPAPSPSSSLQNPPPSYHQYPQYHSHATQQQSQPSPSPSASPSTQKPKKERHPFGGMSASSFLTETLPATGLKLYPGSRKGAKSHGDLLSGSNNHSKGKKSGGGLSSINTSKKQLSPGGRLSGNERTYSSSTSNISSPMTGATHDMTSPTSMSRNHHSSLDARVMAREMSQGHSTEDVWQALCIKVLTLFNGQGLTGAVEDLNELVRRCLDSRTALALCEEINELLKNGMLTLNAKLGDVPDEKLVSRLVEVWSFFFGTVLPYFEGVLLPLQVELKAYHARKGNRKMTPSGASSSALSSSSSSGALNYAGGHESNNSLTVGSSPKSAIYDSDQGQRNDPGPQHVRTMALTSFRDLVILPMVDRLGDVFAKLFMDFDASIPVTDTASRMMQMTSILTSIRSDDAQQLLMEQVSNRLKTNWKQFTRRGNRGGFIGLDKRIAPAASRFH
ncbi:hypothetical protein EMPS_08665 [Entomortierella parvispora]|uniref:Uncharacterized protein n=1 Tax=Entomortierella parvispora TaxID=205924 RepID=A0A9P3HGS7_9FUNG|nr:hypothetical protein EMPS_08665 [Entomortierella parvispora]